MRIRWGLRGSVVSWGWWAGWVEVERSGVEGGGGRDRKDGDGGRRVWKSRGRRCVPGERTDESKQAFV